MVSICSCSCLDFMLMIAPFTISSGSFSKGKSLNMYSPIPAVIKISPMKMLYFRYFSMLSTFSTQYVKSSTPYVALNWSFICPSMFPAAATGRVPGITIYSVPSCHHHKRNPKQRTRRPESWRPLGGGLVCGRRVGSSAGGDWA